MVFSSNRPLSEVTKMQAETTREGFKYVLPILILIVMISGFIS